MKKLEISLVAILLSITTQAAPLTDTEMLEALSLDRCEALSDDSGEKECKTVYCQKICVGDTVITADATNRKVEKFISNYEAQLNSGDKAVIFDLFLTSGSLSSNPKISVGDKIIDSSENKMIVSGVAVNGKDIMAQYESNSSYDVRRDPSEIYLTKLKECLASNPKICVGDTIIDSSENKMIVSGVAVNGKDIMAQYESGSSINYRRGPTQIYLTRTKECLHYPTRVCVGDDVTAKDGTQLHVVGVAVEGYRLMVNYARGSSLAYVFDSERIQDVYKTIRSGCIHSRPLTKKLCVGDVVTDSTTNHEVEVKGFHEYSTKSSTTVLLYNGTNEYEQDPNKVTVLIPCSQSKQ